MTVTEEISECKLDLMEVQEVIWDKGGTEPTGECTFFDVQGDENHEVNNFLCRRITPAVKRVEFISDRMPYIILKGRWCDIMVLNVHAPTEDKIYDIVTCQPIVGLRSKALLGSRQLNASRTSTRSAAVGEAVFAPCRAAPSGATPSAAAQQAR
jgi:hypothetical protein